MEFQSHHYQIEPGSHQGKPVLWLRFAYEPGKIEAVKAIGARWSQSQKCWYLKDNAHNRELCGLPEKSTGKEALARLGLQNRQALISMQEQLRLKAYSPATIRTYTIELTQLLYPLGDTGVNSLSPAHIRAYMLYCIDVLKLSENTLHSRLNAIKFYFEQVLGREQFFLEIPRPKKPSILPKALSTKDIQKILASVTNPKHRLMLELCYGMGLRVSELVALKIDHIDSSRMQVLIAGARGKKDRYVPLPQSVLAQLREYYKHYQPRDFLFEGQAGGAYAIRSVQAVFKQAMKKARVRKAVGIHGLRHSYATHLHEYGTDITLIQKLLGHNNLKTTMPYVSQQDIASLTSPLDRINNAPQNPE
jgi:integrase/recombinase XerD